jgi:hypothetical protein
VHKRRVVQHAGVQHAGVQHAGVQQQPVMFVANTVSQHHYPVDGATAICPSCGRSFVIRKKDGCIRKHNCDPNLAFTTPLLPMMV